MNYVLVGIGGMLGAMARYGASSFIFTLHPNQKFPLGTFAVNLVGCLLIGVIASLAERLSFLNVEARLFCITGFLGGFTTFSAFGIETFQLLRGGHTYWALTYLMLSVTLGVFLVALGLRLKLVESAFMG